MFGCFFERSESQLSVAFPMRGDKGFAVWPFRGVLVQDRGNRPHLSRREYNV
jgi:hypothetical protein